MNRGLTALAALAALALAVLPAGVLAAPTPPQHPQNAIVVGTLSSAPASGTAGTITVATPNNATATIPVGAHTHYQARSSAAYKAGLKSGDQVIVFTSTTKAGTVAVTVQYDLKPFGITTRVGGTITGSAAGSLTLTTPANTALTATTTSKTKYAVDNRPVKVTAALPTNEPAMVTGLYMTTGESIARFVSLGLPAKHIPVVLLHGTIGTQGPTTLAVTTHAHKTLQVSVSTSTLYIVDGTLVTMPPTITSTEKVDVAVARPSGGAYAASSVWVKTH